MKCVKKHEKGAESVAGLFSYVLFVLSQTHNSLFVQNVKTLLRK